MRHGIGDYLHFKRLLEHRSRFVPVGGLLVGVGDLEEARFFPWLADELQADGKLLAAFVCEAAREAEAAGACEVARDGEDVGEIHFQWIVGAVAG